MPLSAALPRRKPAWVAQGQRVRLRRPMAGDFEAWATLRAESRAYLVPWEPSWAPDELSRDSYRRRLRRYAEAEREGAGHMFFIFADGEDKLIGGIQLSNIRQGVAVSSASMGYWMAQRHAGRGYMSDAVNAVVRHAFGRLGLHRVEAACLPSNAASRRVLAKCGFTAEGTARKYLRINGEWQDHLLFAIVAGDPLPAVRYRDLYA